MESPATNRGNGYDSYRSGRSLRLQEIYQREAEEEIRRAKQEQQLLDWEEEQDEMKYRAEELKSE